MKLIPEDSEILYKEGEDINLSNPQIDLISVFDEMKILMNIKKGIGLAAPQIGLHYKVFIFTRGEDVLEVVNPTINRASENLVSLKEGCLSFPGLYLKISRPEWVDVSFYDKNLSLVKLMLDGMDARCFNHEYDHVYGVTIKDRVPKVTLKMALARRLTNLRKLRRVKNV